MSTWRIAISPHSSTGCSHFLKYTLDAPLALRVQLESCFAGSSGLDDASVSCRRATEGIKMTMSDCPSVSKLNSGTV